MTDRLEHVDEVIGRIEQALLVILLSLMIFTAFFQIFLRNLFASGLAWGDSFVRNLVLWVGFIGAAMATREGKHISIDLISRWDNPAGRRLAESLTHLFSFLVCSALTFAALKFVRNEAQMGKATFLGIPAWIPEIILPATFALMALRFGLRLWKTLSGTSGMDRRPLRGERT